MMTAQQLNYIVCLRFGGRQYFLLWQDGGNQPDIYVLQANTSCLLLASTAKALLENASKLDLQVADQEAVIVDMDEVFVKLAELRSRPPSQRTCQLLLDGWNTLEDMARSIQLPLEEQERGLLKKAYDKLFYGNNIPAVTPKNRNYSPLFSVTERQAIRRHLRCMWQKIFERCFMSQPARGGLAK